jgi:HEAT repeat protein
MLKEKAGPTKADLLKTLDDSSPRVQVVAAEALCHLGEADQGLKRLGQLLADTDAKVRLQAANSLDHLGPVAKPALPALRLAAADPDDYVKRAARYTAAMLAGEPPPGEGE